MKTWDVIELLKDKLPKLTKELPGVEFRYAVKADTFQILWQGQVVGYIFADGMLNLDLIHTSTWRTLSYNRPQSVKAIYSSLEAFLNVIKRLYNPAILKQHSPKTSLPGELATTLWHERPDLHPAGSRKGESAQPRDLDQVTPQMLHMA